MRLLVSKCPFTKYVKLFSFSHIPFHFVFFSSLFLSPSFLISLPSIQSPLHIKREGKRKKDVITFIGEWGRGVYFLSICCLFARFPRNKIPLASSTTFCTIHGIRAIFLSAIECLMDILYVQ